MKIEDFPIGIRLIGGFAIITFLLILVGWIGFITMNQMAEKTEKMYDESTIPLYLTGNIEVGLNSIRALAFRMVAVPEENEGDRVRINDEIQAVELNLTALKEIPMDKEQEKAVNLFESQWIEYKSVVNSLINLSSLGKTAEFKAMLANEGEHANARRATVSTFTVLKELSLEKAREENKTAEENKDNATTVMIIIIIMSSAGCIALGILLTKSITTPLLQVVNILGNMEKGNLKTRLQLSRKDEIGTMATSMDHFSETLESQIVSRITQIGNGEDVKLLTPQGPEDQISPALNTMIQSLSHMQDEVIRLTHAASAGDLKARGDDSLFNGKFKEIISSFNEALDVIIAPLQEAKRLSEEYAAGNLSERFSPDVKTKGEFIEFKNDLNQIGIAMSSVLNEILTDMTSLQKESQNALLNIEEISTGSDLLSETAKNVRISADETEINFTQILKAMEDLSLTVAGVASKTELVSSFALKADTDSKDGAISVESAGDGMDRIADSVHDVEKQVQEVKEAMSEIGSIVHLISNISEQTNLLALNAAIEAARAGEAGLGFAVVADEVKSLANESQKSSEKVSEIISNLVKKTEEIVQAIEGAVKQVQNGHVYVKNTVSAFSEIGVSIETLSSHVTDVAAAAEEQAASVEEVTASIHETSATISGMKNAAVQASDKSMESTTAIHDITRVIDNLSATITRVRAMIDQFTI